MGRDSPVQYGLPTEASSSAAAAVAAAAHQLQLQQAARQEFLAAANASRFTSPSTASSNPGVPPAVAGVAEWQLAPYWNQKLLYMAGVPFQGALQSLQSLPGLQNLQQSVQGIQAGLQTLHSPLILNQHRQENLELFRRKTEGDDRRSTSASNSPVDAMRSSSPVPPPLNSPKTEVQDD